jgi:hypothetical protein
VCGVLTVGISRHIEPAFTRNYELSITYCNIPEAAKSYLTLDFLEAKYVTVQSLILMAYDIQKASKIFEKEKVICIIKLNLRSHKICFA